MSTRRFDSFVYPVPQNAPHVSAGMNVLNLPEGQSPKATDVSPWLTVGSIPLVLPAKLSRSWTKRLLKRRSSRRLMAQCLLSTATLLLG